MDLFADPDFVRDELEVEPRPAPLPALKLPPGMKWRAHSAEGLGHLLPVGATRYLCDERAIAERYAWPVLRQCQRCVTALEWGR